MPVNTNNGKVQPFQVFDYNISVGTIPALASVYSFVWGASQAAWRQNSSSIETSGYFPMLYDYGTFGSGGSNAQNLAWWQANHPDWIVYTSDGITPSYTIGYTYVPLDFSNPAVITWQYNQYAVPIHNNPSHAFTYAGVDVVNLDNYQGAYGVYPNATPGSPFAAPFTQLFSGNQVDSAYASAVATYIQSLASQVQALGLKFVPNFNNGSVALTDASCTSILTASDAILDERGFTNLGALNDTGTDWINRINFIQSSQSQGKQYYLLNILPSSLQSAKEYALMSYYLAKGSGTSLFFTEPANSPVYGSNLYSNYSTEYTLDIGTISGAMTNPSSNVYTRSFANGIVAFCNANFAGNYPLALSGSYHSLYSGPSATPNGGLYSGTIQLQPGNPGQALVLQPYSTPAAITPSWLFHS